MKKNISKVFLILMVCIGFPSILQSQSVEALMDILIRKKIITQKEAQEVRREFLEENTAHTSSARIELPKHVSKLKLSGDGRLRYQYDKFQFQRPSDGRTRERTRPRVRLRLSADYILNEGFSGGLGVQTGKLSSSGNVTLEDGFENLELYLSKVWIKWKHKDWFTLSLGKQNNVFYKTGLLWEPSIYVTGAVESIRWDASEKLSFILNGGQFIFDVNTDSPTTIATNINDRRSPWMFNQQLISRYKISKGINLTLAPGFLTYTPGRVSMIGSAPLNSSIATKYLDIVSLAGDLSWKADQLPMKFYWDIVWNLSAEKRMSQVYGINDHRDDLAWLVGLSVGSLKKKGNWKASVDYRQVGLGAIDPNINDAVFGDSQLNQEGLNVVMGYSFTDFLVGYLRYTTSWNYKSDLYHPSVAKGNSVSILQTNLLFRF